MNRYLVYKDLVLKVVNNLTIPKKISHNNQYTKVDFIINDDYYNIKNEHFIVVDVKISYGTLEWYLDMKKSDLYYLNTPQEKISKKEILDIILKKQLLETLIERKAFEHTLRIKNMEE